MKILIIDNAEPADSQFNKPLFDLVATLADCDVVNYRAIPSRAMMWTSYGAALISGVPLHYSFDSVERRLEHYSWVSRTQLPTLGICLGHQIIGKLFGAEIVRGKESESGLLKTFIDQEDSVLAGMTSTFESFMMHRASVTLPKQFQVLAHSDICSNVIMKHRQKAIYGVQSHPELSSNGVALLNNFVALAEADWETRFTTTLPDLDLYQQNYLSQLSLDAL